MLVSDGQTVMIQGVPYSQFGLTKDGNFVLGYLTVNDTASFQFEQLVTGFDMLVQSGIVVTSPGGGVAPRTAIGVSKSGDLMVLEADGIEGLGIGLTLNDLALWMQQLGFYHALNLDGGTFSFSFSFFSTSFPLCSIPL